MSDHFDLRDRGSTISVCLPSVNEQATIGVALKPLIAMREEGLLDQVVVVDESTDYTADIAMTLGAEVHRQRDLIPELGPMLGKGDAMWRALSVLTGDIILYLDADSQSIQRHYVIAMAEPILRGEADFVKGYYKRPLGNDPDGGGRLNHLFARPLIRAYFPELAWVEQPLAGETALTRELALRLPFEPNWAMLALLIDAHLAGARIAQANLGIHEHRHWPLRKLAERCDELLAVILARATKAPSIDATPTPRPPMWLRPASVR